MRTDIIKLETADGPMGVYEAVPDGVCRAAVIVVQEAFGVNEHIKDVTRRVADAGFHAVAPELFHRAGAGTAPYDDFEKVIPLFAGLDDDALLVDIDAVIEYLNGLGFENEHIGTVGFCMGGRVTFLVASCRRLGAAVGFYGGAIVTQRLPLFPSLLERGPSMEVPWLGFFGDRDEGIPVDDVEKLRAALAQAPAVCEIVRYADAEHGFHCDARSSYHEADAKDAWTRTLAWLERLRA